MKLNRLLLLLAALSITGCAAHSTPTTFGLATFGKGERAMWINWEPDVSDSAPTYLIPDEGVTALGVSPEGDGPAWTVIWGGESGRYELTFFGDDEPHSLEVLQTLERLEVDQRVAYIRSEDAHAHSGEDEHEDDHDHGLKIAIKDGKNGGSDLLFRADGSIVLIPADDPEFWDERLGGVPGRGVSR